MIHTRPHAEACVIGREVFALRLIGSRGFGDLYEGVMSAVERCARYLEGEGRRQAAAMSVEFQARYSRHAMWLTAGLMRSASIVLVVSAVKKGDMPYDGAMREIEKTRAGRFPPGSLEGMPCELSDMIEEHGRLVDALDRFVNSIIPALNPSRASLQTSNKPSTAVDLD